MALPRQLNGDDYGPTRREPSLIRMFQAARTEHPHWNHTQLLVSVWKRRPEGTTMAEAVRIANRFRLPI
jgi:hypothetical protein